MENVKLNALSVSALGLGCMGMSEYYGPTDWDESIATVHRAIDLGVTFFDTAASYGAGHNEVLVGRALAQHRDQVQIATKFGIDRSAGDGARLLRGSAGYVKRSCDASLLRLGTDVIDLFYMHRPPQDVEIEETIQALADLVADGKIRHIGLSEVTEDQLRRAHAVHPITAVQSEYSLWTRDVETIVPTMVELGVGLVPFSPLGRGFLTGTFDPTKVGSDDMRSVNERFVGENLDANQAIAETVREVAAEQGVTPAQLALAWVLAQAERLGLPVVPIPGTKRTRYLEQNVEALDVQLDESTLARLAPLSDDVRGNRAYAASR